MITRHVMAAPDIKAGPQFRVPETRRVQKSGMKLETSPVSIKKALWTWPSAPPRLIRIHNGAESQSSVRKHHQKCASRRYRQGGLDHLKCFWGQDHSEGPRDALRRVHEEGKKTRKNNITITLVRLA